MPRSAARARGNSKPKSKTMKTRTVKRPASGSHRRPAKLWQLRLYVAGQTPKSLTAFSNLKQICENHLKGRYSIEVIDLVEQPQLSKATRSWPFPRWCASCRSPCEKSLATCPTPSACSWGWICAPPINRDERP